MARTPAPGTRDRILDNSARLFRAHGVRAVGMQQIIDECGCGKNLLYREFASKDDLVVAYLDRCQQEWATIMDDAARPYAGSAAGQLVALVRAVVHQVADADFRGCPFRTTRAEFPDPDHVGHRAAVTHVKAVRTRLRRLAKHAGAHDPQILADRLLLIIDGVYINAAMLGTAGAASAAVDLAEELVRSATDHSSRRNPG